MNKNTNNIWFSHFLLQRNYLNLFLLLTVALLSCEAPKKSYPTEIKSEQVDIEELIGKHRSETVFLSFWKDMNRDDFELVKEYETQKGNLEDGNFELLFENGSRSRFRICSEGKAIALYFHEKQTVATNMIDGLLVSRPMKAIPFDYVENKLVSLFESKHIKLVDRVEDRQCIDAESLEIEYARSFHTYYPMHIREAEYQSTNNGHEIVISLHSEYSYWDRDFDIRKAKPGVTDYYWHENRDETSAVISECKITLMFELRSDYLARKDLEEKQRDDHEKSEKNLEHEFQEKVRNNNNLL